MEKRQNSAQDRLSELPDSLILKILSLLEMRDVVRSNLLSKRWTDLWTAIPCLNFNELGKKPVQTRNFINRVLLRWNGASILEFEISFSRYKFYSSLSADMNFWLRFATDKQVKELYLYLPLQTHDPAYELPQCVYSCSSITQLLLTGCNLQIRRNVEWDQLKGLTLHGLCFGEDVINQVVSSSPRLESLDLLLTKSRDQNLSIKSSSLKCLTIMKHMLKTAQYDRSMYSVLTISAPKLESLSISGAAYRACLLMDVSSLIDLALGFEDVWDVAIGETMRQFLPTIQHVDALALSPCCFKMLEVMRGKYSFSPFLNMKQLGLCGGGPIKPNDIVSLVKIFPKVEKLVIDWTSDELWYPSFLANLSSKQDIGEDSLEYEANDLKSFLMMQLRAVEINWYSYEVATIFQFIKFLLKHTAMVQKIVIRQSGGRVVEFEGLEELLSLLRSFPTIHLILCKS